MKVHIKMYSKIVVGCCLPLYYSQYEFERTEEIIDFNSDYFKVGYLKEELFYTNMCATKATIERNNYIKDGELYLNFSRKEEMYAF